MEKSRVRDHLGLPFLLADPARRRWVARVSSSRAPRGDAAGSGALCGLRSAKQRPRREPTKEGVLAGLAGRRITSLGRKEMNHLLGAVGWLGASVETQPQEPGTMMGSERNVGLASAALHLHRP